MNIIRLNTLNDDKVIIRGNGGNSGGGDYHYLNFISPYAKDYIQYASEVKISSLGVIAMATVAFIEGEEAISLVTSAKFDFNLYSSYSSEGKVKVREMISSLIGTVFEEITEEEFYSLKNPVS